MANPLVERFQTLKAKKEEAEKMLIEKKAYLSQSEENLAAALAELQENFNVSSVEEAEKLLLERGEELSAKLAELEGEIAGFERAIFSA
jgi:hypothetical protein